MESEFKPNTHVDFRCQAINQVHDVIIIGAGPCGLAIAARLRETTPSALFTDAEHQRYHWIQRHKHRTRMVPTKGRATNQVLDDHGERDNRPQTGGACEGTQCSIVVLDSFSDSWMAKWNALFRALEIKNLRSPLFFHPDPADRNGLKGWAYSQGREREMVELKGVVGKELSKHRVKSGRKRKSMQGPRGKSIDERDKQDYFTPSTALFNDFCLNCVERYKLDDLIVHAHVSAIHFNKEDSKDEMGGIFKVETSSGNQYARSIVLAIGAGNPTGISSKEEESIGACHSSDLLKQNTLAPHVQQKIDAKEDTAVIVVGGGLTSAQIVDLCISKGVSRVWHIMRGHFKVKHFDLDLSWVAKYKNVNMSAFWMADTDEERLEMLQTARNGGSITPAYKTILDVHERRGRLRRHTQTRVVARDWDAKSKKWKVVTEPPIPDLPAIDYIYFATGTGADVHSLPLLQPLLKSYPIPTMSGLPCLTDDLQWSSEVPLFVTGRLAGLRLGPGAANLEGARVGAERITWKLQEILDGRTDDHDDATGDCSSERLKDLQERLSSEWIHLNMYNALYEV